MHNIKCANAVNAEQLDQQTLDNLQKIQFSKKEIEIMLDEIRQLQKEQHTKNIPRLTKIANTLKELQKQ